MDNKSHRAQCFPLNALLTAVFLAIATAASPIAQGQTFTLLHSFTGGADGQQPQTSMTLDRGGNLYGTTVKGGFGYGTVFKLSQRNSAWLLSPLYSFRGGTDGISPFSQLIFGPDGALYGTTQHGGVSRGTVFKLRPPATACASVFCPWTETQLYAFTDHGDSEYPQGDITFDPAGNLYGGAAGLNIASQHRTPGLSPGAIYELMPSADSWTIDILWSFPIIGDDGNNPNGGVILDRAGNIFGTTIFGGQANYGTVFELQRTGFGWSHTTLHSFNYDDGLLPQAGLVADAAGNFYGAAFGGGQLGGGVIFEMTPFTGGWTFNVLYELPFGMGGPLSTLAIDSNGNLFGATYGDGQYQQGNVFKLSRSGGTWVYTDLYDFTGGSDGYYPVGGVTLDAAGNIYGTASQGGAYGAGTAWMVTP